MLENIPIEILLKEICELLPHNDKVHLMMTNKEMWAQMIDLVQKSKIRTIYSASMKKILSIPKKQCKDYCSHYIKAIDENRTHHSDFNFNHDTIRTKIYFKTKTNEQGFKFRYANILHHWDVYFKSRNRKIKIECMVGKYSMVQNKKTHRIELWKCVGYKYTSKKDGTSSLRFEWKEFEYKHQTILKVESRGIDKIPNNYLEFTDNMELLKDAYRLIRRDNRWNEVFLLIPTVAKEIDHKQYSNGSLSIKKTHNRKLVKWSKFFLYDIHKFLGVGGYMRPDFYLEEFLWEHNLFDIHHPI